MNLQDVRWRYAIGGAIAAEVLMIIAAIAWVALYSYFIHPGETPEFYQEYAQAASPWVAVISGIPAFYLVCRWIAICVGAHAMPTAVLLFGIYLLMDLPVLLLTENRFLPFWLAVLSYVSKLAACYAGAKSVQPANSF
jgi:hypothetical protein